MLKASLTVLFLVVSTNSIAQPKDAENFDKGKNFQECMDNCRHHHRAELKMPEGSGKGQCWSICHKEHPTQGESATE